MSNTTTDNATPGPWEAVVFDSLDPEAMRGYVQDAIDVTIARYGEGLPLWLVETKEPPYPAPERRTMAITGNGPHGEANARLIAAAPDLLAALEAWPTEAATPDQWAAFFDGVRAAIAKVRGS